MVDWESRHSFASRRVSMCAIFCRGFRPFSPPYASAPAVAAGPTFPDVPESHWAYSYVERAAENGWVNGTGNGQFAPGGTLTFAEFYTMIVPVFAP